ncbi:MAG: hypothetical protein WC626_13280, partial [Methanoregula sp.]
MNSTDNKKVHYIFLAVCCSFFISWIAIFSLSPGYRIFVGTCGSDTIPLNYSTDIEPEYDLSFLHEFGEREPDRS